MSGQDDDRISSLPDAILCHILSFLPTKHSVRTRLVSTRWKYLFAHVPVLDFDLSTYTENDISGRKFIDFVNRVLMMYSFPQTALFRFRFQSRTFANQLDDLVSWILFAIRHNVRELDICAYLEKLTTIPQELFSSKRLSVLKLEGKFCFKPFPSCALLPSLKTLELAFISFDLSAQSILSICPVLEDLILYCCDFRNEKVIDITNTSLRNLRIVEGYGYSHTLVLNVPSLVCFVYWSSDISGFRGENALTSLVEAVINPDTYICSATTFLQLLNNVVSHARHLYLSSDSFGALYGCVKALPTFHKLTRLEVGEVSQAVYELLPDFLNSCSILEVLVFTEGGCDTVERISDIYNNVPSCVLRNLKQVEFRVFTMLETEWKLVEYFFKKAQVLQKIKIQSRLNRKKLSKLGKKLSTLSKFRHSKDCQNVVEFDDGTKDCQNVVEFDDGTKDWINEIIWGRLLLYG